MSVKPVVLTGYNTTRLYTWFLLEMADTTVRNILSIGALLCDCGVLPRPDLEKITASAAHQELTMGQYLIRNNLVGPIVVRSAVLCQLMLRRKWLTYNIVLEAMQMVIQTKCTIEEALQALKWNRFYFENIFQMSDLMIKSEMVDADDISLAQDVCLQNESPILSVLVRRNALSDLKADQVLSTHERFVRKEISFEQAVEILRGGAQQAPKEKGPYVFQPLRLGEILLAAELISSADLIASIEKARAEQTRFGNILVRDYGLDQEVLNRALFMQSQINSEFISVFDGIQGLANATSAIRKESVY